MHDRAGEPETRPIARRVDLARVGVVVVMLLSLGVAMRGLGQSPPNKTVNASVVYQIDVNRADAAELMLLPGVGPSKADAIVAYRRVHGPFAEPKDLVAVHGIGAIIVRRITPYIVCGSPSVTAAPASGSDP